MVTHCQRLRAIVEDVRRSQPGRADDLELAAKEIERLERRLEELVGFINGMAINCAIVARAGG